MMTMIGTFAVTGLLALALDEGNRLGQGASIALFTATAVAWGFLLL